MEKAIQVLNAMQANGIIKNYAICGGIAAIFYIEPILTYDLDIFFVPADENDGLLSLSSVYDYLKDKGYSAHKEHMVIENIPVQFLPVYNELVEEAVCESLEVDYKNTKARVLKPEHLIAIMLQTYRPKDRDRIFKFLEDAEIDEKFLQAILDRFGLQEKFEKLMRLYHGE